MDHVGELTPQRHPSLDFWALEAIGAVEKSQDVQLGLDVAKLEDSVDGEVPPSDAVALGRLELGSPSGEEPVEDLVHIEQRITQPLAPGG